MTAKFIRTAKPSRATVPSGKSICGFFIAAVLLTVCGCETQHIGNYKSTIRIKRGIEDTSDESIQAELAKAKERTKGFVEKLRIKSGGRYWKKNIDREFDGDWWITEDGKLANRTTHQNGKSLGSLASKGADRLWEIGDDGNLYRYWMNPDSNLEFVFVKQ